MTSDALIAMIERKLKAYGLEKVIPDDDLLGEDLSRIPSQPATAREIRGDGGRVRRTPKSRFRRNLKEQVRAVLDEHGDLRWDDAIQIVLDKTQLDRVRAEKQKAKKKSGDFTDADEDDGAATRLSNDRRGRPPSHSPRCRRLVAAGQPRTAGSCWRAHGWLRGDRRSALVDAHWMAGISGFPVREAP